MHSYDIILIQHVEAAISFDASTYCLNTKTLYMHFVLLYSLQYVSNI